MRARAAHGVAIEGQENGLGHTIEMRGQWGVVHKNGNLQMESEMEWQMPFVNGFRSYDKGGFCGWLEHLDPPRSIAYFNTRDTGRGIDVTKMMGTIFVIIRENDQMEKFRVCVICKQRPQIEAV